MAKTQSQSDGLETGILDQLHEAAIYTATVEQTWRDSLETRDRLVVDAYDQGHSIPDVARAALMGRARVHQIVARRG